MSAPLSDPFEAVVAIHRAGGGCSGGLPDAAGNAQPHTFECHRLTHEIRTLYTPEEVMARFEAAFKEALRPAN